jgi:hypothetical protein
MSIDSVAPRSKNAGFALNPRIFLLLLVTLGFICTTLSALSAQEQVTGKQPRTIVQDGALSARSKAINKLAALPLGFESNRGQLDPRVKYSAKGSQYTLFLTPSEAVFALPKKVEIPSSIKSITAQAAVGETSQPSTWTSIGLRFSGATPAPTFSAHDQLPGVKNYFVGRDKSKWATDVPLYSLIQEHDVYPGIDIAYRSTKHDLEFDFLVNPGADAKQIHLEFEGAKDIWIDDFGNLILSSTAGDVHIHRPIAYQEASDGKRAMVNARFTKHRNGGIRLALGDYDHRRQLIIDPTVTYATYLGGTAEDIGLGIAIDDGGDTYVTGGTASPSFPNTGGGTSYSGGLDVFVTEFNSSDELIFSTIIGGSLNDVGTSIAVSFEGANSGIFVTGYTTSPDFPAFVNQLTLNGIQNAFVLMLHFPEGYYITATYLGGEAVDAGLAITFDTIEGYVYVAGQTTSQQFPISSPLFNESQLNMGAGSGPSDGFVSQLYPDLSGFWFSTFLGGTNQDFASGIALDHQDSTYHNIYITGGTNSGGSSSPPSFYATPGAFQATCGTDGNCNDGKDDAFITVLCTYREAPCSAVGLTPNYVYSTFIGGSGKDDAYSIAADASSNAYVTGQTNSTAFKLAGPYQSTLRGSQNAFVSKMNAAGSGLVFSTYLGGSRSDSGLGLAIDDNRNVYITGRTSSSDFPTLFPTQSTIGGANDAFISAFDSSGSALTFSTFLGGSGDEDIMGGSIAVDSTQNVYVTGDTNSTNFPTQNPYQGTIASTQDCTINGNQVLCPDAYVAKLNVQAPNASILTVTIPIGPEGSVSSSPTGIDCTNGSPPGICTAEFADGTEVTLTATPNEDLFGGWSGDAPNSCGMNLTCVIDITSNMDIIAIFNPVVGQLYELLVQGAGINGQSGTGTITSSPAGIDCGTGGQVCQFDFAPGTQVTLTATPDPGNFFDGWSQNQACSGTGPCVLLMNSNQTVDYTFLPNNAPPPVPDFTITVNPASLGLISVGTQGVAGIAIATLNGFTDTINLSCSVQPASASAPSCAVSPSTLGIQLGGAGSATLTVNTTGLTAMRKSRITAATLAFCIPFMGALFSGMKSRYSRRGRHWLKVLLSAVLLGIICLGVACGGSSGSRASGGTAQPGSYTVVISAQGESTLITHTAEVSVTVQ